MVARSEPEILDLLVEPLGHCLTEESARRLLNLRADSQLQAIVNRLGQKCNEGKLTPEERAQYEAYVSFGSFVALLKSKARKMLSTPSGTR